MFVSGCGRFFEGEPQEMHEALNVKLAALPDDTVTYVGHEYTASNVAFSSKIEPDNEAIQKLVKYCEVRLCLSLWLVVADLGRLADGYYPSRRTTSRRASSPSATRRSTMSSCAPRARRSRVRPRLSSSSLPLPAPLALS